MSQLIFDVFAVAWDVTLIAAAVALAAIALVLFGGMRRVDQALTFPDPAERARRDDRAVANQLYPARRDVMGVQQEAPEPVRTASGARHIKGELLDGHRR